MCPILHKIVCIEIKCNGFVLVLNEVDLIHFVCSKCIRSIWTKTNTKVLHSNLIHSILHKNLMILPKSDAWRWLYLFFQSVIIIATNGHRRLDLFFQVKIIICKNRTWWECNDRKKKCTVLWPAMFFQRVQITTGKN